MKPEIQVHIWNARPNANLFFPQAFTHQEWEQMMGLAAYDIVGTSGLWRVQHDGKAENAYETKESAFEAAVAAASRALRQGHEVRITAPASETATGAANAG